METAANHEYEFKPLAVSEWQISEFHRRVYMVAQLVPFSAGQKPRIYMFNLINEFENIPGRQDWFWGGIPVVLALHLQAAIKRDATIKIQFTGPIVERDETDPAYDVYTYNPTYLSNFNEILIPNPDDPSNFYSFRYKPTKRPAATDTASMMPRPQIDSVLMSLEERPFVSSSGVHPLFVSYTREDLTFRSSDGGRIYGNWSTSFTGACAGGPNNSSIEANGVTSVERLPGPCSSGQTILRWTYY